MPVPSPGDLEFTRRPLRWVDLICVDDASSLIFALALTIADSY